MTITNKKNYFFSANADVLQGGTTTSE